MTRGDAANERSNGEEDGKAAWCLRIRSVLESVGQANRSLETFLRNGSVCPDVVFSAVLALEEVVTNVIKYSCEQDADHEILLEAHMSHETLVLRVTDDGREFDPLSAAPPDMEKPPEDRPPGGLGIHLFRSLADRIEYERTSGTNILTLFFALKAQK